MRIAVCKTLTVLENRTSKSPIIRFFAAAAFSYLPSCALAQTVNVSYSGTVGGPNTIDYDGLFGPVGANLNGDTIQIDATYLPPDFSPVSGYVDYWSSSTSGAMTISITINGITQTETSTSGGSGFSPTAFVSNIPDKNKNFINLQADDYAGDAYFLLVYASKLKSPSLDDPGQPITADGEYVYFYNGGTPPYADEYISYNAQTNPYSSHLAVASPFLLAPQSLGDIDLPTLLPTVTNLSSVSATGLAADGVSAAIVLFSTTTQSDVTFTTNNGTLLLPYDPTFMTYAPSSGGSSTLTVTAGSLIQIGSLFYAAALVQAPLSGASSSYASPTVITAQQEGEAAQQVNLPLVPPPVILIHGLWGNDHSLDYIESNLSAQQPWSSYPGDIYVLSYDGSQSFTAVGARSHLQVQAASIIQKMQSNGIVGARLNVVAHSMGGLVLRAYSRGTASGPCDSMFGIETAPYRSLGDRCQGQFNNIITLDTPEAGSGLATYLIAHQNDLFQAYYSRPDLYFWRTACGSFSITISQCLGNDNEIVAGAVSSLVQGSKELSETPSPNIPGSTWNAVTATNTSGVERHVLGKLIESVNSSAQTTPSLDEVVGSPNDDVVSLASQLAFTPAGNVTFLGLAHSNILGKGAHQAVPTSPAVAAQTACWLNNPTNSQCSANSEVKLIAENKDADIHLVRGRLAASPALTGFIGHPLALHVHKRGLRNLDVEQIGESDRVDDLLTPSVVPGEITDFVFVPRVIGKVHLKLNAEYEDGGFDSIETEFTAKVNPSEIVSLDAEPGLKKLFGSPKLTYQLNSEIKVQGLASSVRLGSFATYNVVSLGIDPAVSVDSKGEITMLHPGEATIGVSFEGHNDQIKVTVN